ncbi:unnamed protein product [Aureobasidium uvarum]|uniref:Ubiquitin-like domain-containing protein n=1 Tax=Aureobasidium uvarum TaxID=2773716 RepID=A0A9N8KH02_9PEZI|nr:unnamed protein product [Aureobasidium uvarum]
MDLASGIVGIVGVGIQICATLYKIGEAATSAGDEIPELIGHIEFTNNILNTVQKELQKAEVKAIIDSNAAESVRNAMTKLDILMLMNVLQISVIYRLSNAGMSSQHIITDESPGHQDAIEDGKQKLLDLAVVIRKQGYTVVFCSDESIMKSETASQTGDRPELEDGDEITIQALHTVTEQLKNWRCSYKTRTGKHKQQKQSWRQNLELSDSIQSHIANGRYQILGPEGQIILPEFWELLVESEWHLSMQLLPVPDETETTRERTSKQKHKREPYQEARRHSSGEVIVASDSPNLPDAPAIAEMARAPIYPRIHQKYLDLETLEHYQLPWVLDSSNKDYLIILRELDKYETDVLFEHTRRRRMDQSPPKERRYAWVRSKGVTKDLDDHQSMGAVDRPEQTSKTLDGDEAIASLVLKYTNLEEFEGYERGHHNSQLAVRKADIGLQRGE